MQIQVLLDRSRLGGGGRFGFESKGFNQLENEKRK